MILGVDTSNYTTSSALFDVDKGEIYNFKKMLPVKQGERGLRQSDAVFHHTENLPAVINGAFEKYPLAVKLHIADIEATYLIENK